jgi:diacylglycerol O-acyltransferase / wax synthase
MNPDRLSPLDANFLHLEKGELAMHVGGLLVFDGPTPTYEQWRRAIELRLPRIPRYRQRVREIPLQLSSPVWVDDQHFNLDEHLRQVGLPAPGDELQLRALTSRLMERRIDMSRPLWEMCLIDGLAGGRWALLNKVHHAMVDGHSGRDIIEILLSTAPDDPDPTPQEWQPDQEPDAPTLLGDAVADTVVDLGRTAERLFASLETPREFVQQAIARAAGTIKVGGQMLHTEDFLVGKVGPHRRWTWVGLDLATVKQVKNAFGGTVNDILLSAIAGGFRGLLLERGEDLSPKASIRTMVPVSVRRPGDRTGGNLVSAVFTDLPVGQPDPVDRLHTVIRAMEAVKRSPDALSVPTIISAAPFMPPALLAAAGRVSARLPQRAVGTVATNVPGPQHPLYFLGRQMVAVIPFVPLGPNIRAAIAMMSYNGGIWCGITADYDAVPDVEQIAEGIQASVSDLAAAAARVHGS